jgi:hypothetical protein
MLDLLQLFKQISVYNRLFKMPPFIFSKRIYLITKSFFVSDCKLIPFLHR